MVHFKDDDSSFCLELLLELLLENYNGSIAGMCTNDDAVCMWLTFLLLESEEQLWRYTACNHRLNHQDNQTRLAAEED